MKSDKLQRLGNYWQVAALIAAGALTLVWVGFLLWELADVVTGLVT
jgi:hypothetical protein